MPRTSTMPAEKAEEILLHFQRLQLVGELHFIEIPRQLVS